MGVVGQRIEGLLRELQSRELELSMEDPKGKAGAESEGLSRTVEKFSHNQTKTVGQRRGPSSVVKKEGGREGKRRRSDSYNNTTQRC